MIDALETLYQHKDLSSDACEALFSQIVHGEMDPIIIASLLTALKMKGETPAEIAGAAAALRKAAAPFPKPDYPIADIVGTGGDGLHTINISTTSVFVAAACGVKVCKHGNRSVSSKSGSADLLEHLGVNLTMSAATARRCLDEVGACFIFAPQYHAGIRHAMPVRQTLKTRTLFNVLGPLINPASPEHMLLGVYDPKLLMPIAEALALLNVERALVVHGSGLDEVALHGPTQAVEVNQGAVSSIELSPATFGLPVAQLADIQGGTPEQNAAITRAILQGQGSTAQQHAVAVNVAALLYVCGKADDVAAGTTMALEAMASKKPFELATQLAEVSRG